MNRLTSSASVPTPVFSLAVISIVVLSLVAHNVIQDTAFSSNKKDSTSEDDGHQHASKPMFDFNNKKLSASVLKLATQRGKRWMSFRVSGAQHMSGQVGGKSKQKRPILTLEPNFILKPINLDHRGVREVAFYEAIRASAINNRSGFQTYCSFFGPRDLKSSSSFRNRSFSSWFTGQSYDPESKPCCDIVQMEAETKLLHRLELFTPEYFGMVEHVPDSSSALEESGEYGINYNSHLLLYNLTRHFSKPCVVDLKMGTETFEPDASEEKKVRERKKYPPQAEFGFRLVAMRIYNPSSGSADKDGYLYFPKKFGRSLETRDQVKRALHTFFGGSNLPKEVQANRSAVIKKILNKLKLFKSWFLDNNVFAFSASSILLLYEGDTISNEEDGVQLDMATAKMIDFGRVRRQPGGDIGYLKGLVTLIALLEEILKESFWTEEYSYRT